MILYLKMVSSSLNPFLISAHSFWMTSRSSAAVLHARMFLIRSLSLIGVGILKFDFYEQIKAKNYQQKYSKQISCFFIIQEKKLLIKVKTVFGKWQNFKLKFD